MAKMMIRLAAKTIFLLLTSALAFAVGGPTEKDYRATIQAHPKDTATRLAYATYLEKQAQFEQALEQYKQLVQYKPASVALKRRMQALKTAQKLHVIELWIRGAHPKTQDPESEPAPDINGPDIFAALRNAGIGAHDVELLRAVALVVQRRVARFENLGTYMKAGELKEGADGMIADLSADQKDRQRWAVFTAENGDRRSLIDLLATADNSDSRMLQEFFIITIQRLTDHGK